MNANVNNSHYDYDILNMYKLDKNSLFLIAFTQLQNEKLSINRNKAVKPKAFYLILI